MIFKTNMPSELYLDTGNTRFYKGDRLRIVLKNKNSYIGELVEIKAESIVLFVPICKGDDSTRELMLEDIDKLRLAESNETFETVPYYDAEEKEFWRTHWYTRDGIKEKTPEDIAMLEKFFKEHSK